MEQDDDITYLASRLCEFNLEEIEQQLCTTVVTIENRVRMCMSLLNGIGELHQLNILHRDIKPRNVLIRKNFFVSFDLVLACTTA